ncbi:MAG: DNA-directed RNA polymerase subunit K [Methanobacteriota archaeon]
MRFAVRATSGHSVDYTRFERARLLGARALQISLGAPSMIEIDGALDPLRLAWQELEAAQLPMRVQRAANALR